MTKLYLLSRKIHNLFVFFIIVITIAMSGTGMVLKFPALSNTLPFLSYEVARQTHNQLSLLFSLTLGIMILTGLIMFFYPHLRKTQRETKSS